MVVGLELELEVGMVVGVVVVVVQFQVCRKVGRFFYTSAFISMKKLALLCLETPMGNLFCLVTIFHCFYTICMYSCREIFCFMARGMCH